MTHPARVDPGASPRLLAQDGEKLWRPRSECRHGAKGIEPTDEHALSVSSVGEVADRDGEAAGVPPPSAVRQRAARREHEGSLAPRRGREIARLPSNFAGVRDALDHSGALCGDRALPSNPFLSARAVFETCCMCTHSMHQCRCAST